MTDLADTFRSGLARVREQIAAACAAAGRDPATVRLLPVTKNHPAEASPLPSQPVSKLSARIAYRKPSPSRPNAPRGTCACAGS